MLKKIFSMIITILLLQECANTINQGSQDTSPALNSKPDTIPDVELSSNYIPLEDFFKNPEKTAYKIKRRGCKITVGVVGNRIIPSKSDVY